MKVIRDKEQIRRSQHTFSDESGGDIGTVFEGSPSGGVRRLHVLAYGVIVDLENPSNTYIYPSTFYDVTYPSVEIVVKS